MVNKWMKTTLWTAGIYNLLWGGWVVFFPLHIFELTGAKIPLYPQIWQCVGMIVGVYGLGYWVAANSPLRHWPIILVGLLGKIFGPIGFAYSLSQNIFPIEFAWTILLNDLIWWIPFSLILYKAWKNHRPDSQTIYLDEKTFSNFEQRKRAKFINSLSGMKSANLIATCDQGKKTNVCMVSSVFHLGADPALLGFIIRPDSVRRDTLENLRVNPYFSINHVNKDILERAHQTSARYPQDTSEFQACHLTEHWKEGFQAPFVQESRIRIAAKMLREEKLPENGVHLIIAQILGVDLPKNCLGDDGHIYIQYAGSLGVAGLDAYSDTDFLGRLSYARPDQPLKWYQE